MKIEKPKTAKDRIILALDVDDFDEAKRLVLELKDQESEKGRDEKNEMEKENLCAVMPVFDRYRSIYRKYFPGTGARQRH